MFRPPLHIQGRDPGVFLLVLSAVCLLLWLYSTRLMRKRRERFLPQTRTAGPAADPWHHPSGRGGPAGTGAALGPHAPAPKKAPLRDSCRAEVLSHSYIPPVLPPRRPAAMGQGGRPCVKSCALTPPAAPQCRRWPGHRRCHGSPAPPACPPSPAGGRRCTAPGSPRPSR